MTESPDGLVHIHSGKVRDLYRTPDNRLLMVASDRISAFDYVLESPIPDKGRILTAMTVWWFERLADVVPNHLLSADDPVIPLQWRGRALLCTPLEMVKVECIARGYLTGHGLEDYRATGGVCGIALPGGLLDGSRLPVPIFTPTTKAPLGQHDEQMSYAEVQAQAGVDVAAEIRRITLAVYARGAELAERAGVILADTKVEIGVNAEGRLVLGDEVLTPDSSRFWPADTWQPGRAQPSFDKQYVRDWLLSDAAGWSRGSDAPPALPAEVIAATRARYVDAYERLTGLSFADWPG
ncbi:MAG: phosphoribosylaminoimidazolesuccinocarboxamide synthase [Jatrophihabitantaceae bacterium]